MRKYTQRELKNLVAEGLAVDITNADNTTRKEINEREEYYSQVGFSSGKYGCNGLLFEGKATGQLYAVCARTKAIYLF